MLIQPRLKHFFSEEEREVAEVILKFEACGFPLSMYRVCLLAFQYAHINSIKGFLTIKKNVIFSFGFACVSKLRHIDLLYTSTDLNNCPLQVHTFLGVHSIPFQILQPLAYQCIPKAQVLQVSINHIIHSVFHNGISYPLTNTRLLSALTS